MAYPTEPPSATETPRSPVPDHVPADLVHWVDHHADPRALADPFGYLDGLRETCPVAYSPAYEGFWAVTRWEDQRDVLQQPELFSSRIVGIPGAEWYAGNELLPLALDPPGHTKYRALINPAFSPRRITALEQRIREQSQRLIDEIVERGPGEFEFVRDYAEPLPSLIFTAMMGIDSSEYRLFTGWVDTMLHSAPFGDGLVLRKEAGEQINSYLASVVAERTARRRDDMVSDLIDNEVDGKRLTAEEVVRVCFLLFSAGLDTVTSALGWSFQYLARHPAARAELVAAPERAAGATEEMLRLHSFVNEARTVVRDVEFRGVRMRAGDRVLLHGGAASRDPRQFDDPEKCDFDRKPNRHLAFSAGPHRCAGSHLARLELRTSLDLWHRRIPDYDIPEGAVVPVHVGAVAGIERLPLTF